MHAVQQASMDFDLLHVWLGISVRSFRAAGQVLLVPGKLKDGQFEGWRLAISAPQLNFEVDW